eukprot:529078_1
MLTFNNWPRIFTADASICVWNKHMKPKLDEGKFGTITILQNPQNPKHVCITWKTQQHKLYWRLSSSKLKLKGNRMLILKVLRETDREQQLCIEFREKHAAKKFIRKHHQIFQHNKTYKNQDNHNDIKHRYSQSEPLMNRQKQPYHSRNNNRTKLWKLDAPTTEDFNHVAEIIARNNRSKAGIFCTLRSITKMLLKDGQKNREIDTKNAKVRETLLKYKGVVDFLSLLGFKKHSKKKKLICHNPPTAHVIEIAVHVLRTYEQKFTGINSSLFANQNVKTSQVIPAYKRTSCRTEFGSVLSPHRKLEQYYQYDEVKDVIGEDEFGIIYKCKKLHYSRVAKKTISRYSQDHSDMHSMNTIFEDDEKIDDEIYAVKKIKKSKLHHLKDMDNLLKQDIELLQEDIGIFHEQTQHGGRIFVSKLIDVFMDQNCWYVVINFFAGNNLWARINDASININNMMQSILKGLNFLHEHGIAHLGVKPDNIILNTDNEVHLRYFGVSRLKPGLYKAETPVLFNDLYFIAPEVMKGEYNTKSDIWSLGIVLFMLKFGFPPFFSEFNHPQELMQKIKLGFKSSLFPRHASISYELKDLICKMLETDLSKRLTAAECLQHGYFKLKSQMISLLIVSSLQRFSIQYYFRILLQQYLVKIDASMMELLEKCANENDADEVSAVLIELENALITYSVKCKHFPIPITSKAIQRHTKNINLNSLLKSLSLQVAVFLDEELWEIFLSMDRKHNGFLSNSEMQSAIKRLKTNRQYYHILMKHFQLYKPETIDSTHNYNYEEFLHSLNPQFNHIVHEIPNTLFATDPDHEAKWCFNRILNALKCYQQLQTDDQRAEFVKDCHEKYPDLIDHFIYMVSNCNDQKHIFDHVFKPILNGYNFDNCNIKQCASCSRHWSCNRRNDEEFHDHNIDQEYMFYRDIMDQIHCIIFHLYDVGLRAKVIGKEQHINHNISKGFLQYRINNKKFNIADTHSDVANDTFMDGFNEFVTEFDDIKIETMKKMIIQEEYDSDALQYDVDQNLNIIHKCVLSNISHQKIKEYLHHYFYHIKLSQLTFSVGYRFYYWQYYKNKVQYTMDSTGCRNENVHLGFTPSQLFVNTKYTNLKYEICNNKIFALRIDQYKISFYKTNKYFQGSKKVKKLVYKYNDDDDDLHYDMSISYDSPISFDHLLSICIYCDWGELSTKFSATFRKEKVYESISSVILRNMEVANMARLLRETVELYGYDKCQHEVTGPFFSGMSYMVIPEFNIRLNGPTSTSKQIEVAEQFGQDNGIVIQINNTNASRLRIFSCAFVSDYSEEDEYLFCGGRFGVQVESIIFRGTNDKMTQLITPLFYFDTLLNGRSINEFESDNDYLILKNLIKHKLEINGFKNAYAKYINNTFTAFTNHKKQLVLNLHDIQNNKFKKLQKLILNSSQNKGIVLKKIIFRLFPNVNRIIIYSAFFNKNNYRYHQHPLDLSLLLHIVNESLRFIQKDMQIIIKATQRYGQWQKWKSRSWICDAYDRFIQQLSAHGNVFDRFHMELKETLSWDEWIKEDWLIIKRNH